MYGHEYIEFEVKPDGLLRYANHSNYKRDVLIRKQVYLSEPMLQLLRCMIEQADALALLDDRGWPEPDRNGTQELEIVMAGVHLNVSTAKMNTLVDIQKLNRKGTFSLVNLSLLFYIYYLQFVQFRAA
jgi:protein mago nashi